MQKQNLAFIFIQLIMYCVIFEAQAVIGCRASKGYTKKAPYAGMGRTSKVNGRIKVKGISGHGKRTSKGYTYVNSYSRSR